MSADMEPDVDEVLQAEPTDEPAVKVKMEGPVRTQDLPGKGGATFSRPISTTPYQILRADPRRRKAILSAPDNVAIAYTEHGATQDSTSFIMLANNKLTIEAVTDVWVRAVSPDTTVSVITELWAMGD